MPRLTEEALAATRGLARSLLAEAVGLTPAVLSPEPSVAKQGPPRWKQQTIIQAVEDFVARENRLPRYADWTQAGRWGLPSFDTVRRHCGSCAQLHQMVVQRRQLRTSLMAETPEECVS